MRRRWECGKQKHDSQGKADAAVRSLVARGLDHPEEGPLRSYWCGYCQAWHTGHWTPVRLDMTEIPRAPRRKMRG